MNLYCWSVCTLTLRLSKGGDYSGASQRHKHIQFIPLENLDGPPIDRLARQAHIQIPGLTSHLPVTSIYAHDKYFFLQRNLSRCTNCPMSATHSAFRPISTLSLLIGSKWSYQMHSSNFSTLLSRQFDIIQITQSAVLRIM